MAEYIDKSDTETVFREIRKRLSAKKKDYEAIEFLIKYQMLSVAEEVIHAMPAADVRPVVRGKWKVSVHKTYYDVSCSVCGINSFFQVDEKDSVSYANYCPSCGADMREER